MDFFSFPSFCLKRSLPGYHSGSLYNFPVPQDTAKHSSRKVWWVSTALSSLVVLSPGPGIWVHLGCLCFFYSLFFSSQGYSLPQLCSHETPPWILRPNLGPQCKDLDLLESRGEPRRWSEGWSTCPVRTGWENWGCSDWSGVSGEILEQPSRT